MNFRKFSFRKVAYSILSLYLVVTCYTAFHLLSRRLQPQIENKALIERIKTLSEIADDVDWNPWGEEFQTEQQLFHHQPPELWALQHPLGKRSPLVQKEGNGNEDLVVDIWGKAAIGSYLWEHIIGGLTESRLNGVWSYGEKRIGSILFKYRTGPGVVPNKVPTNTQNLLLVLNGRERSKVEFSKMWLDSLATLPNLRNVGVLLLGNERCDNAWIQPYMHTRGGQVKFLLLVYDTPEVDDVNVYQWPLGVATYRDFPLIDSWDLPLSSPRPYLFNFLGTVYRDSSRLDLMEAINASSFRSRGLVKARDTWLPQETDQTREEYTSALSQSDLTLNPVGKNTECYRIYEAMAFGSVPVLEDVMTPGACQGAPHPHHARSRGHSGTNNDDNRDGGNSNSNSNFNDKNYHSKFIFNNNNNKDNHFRNNENKNNNNNVLINNSNHKNTILRFAGEGRDKETSEKTVSSPLRLLKELGAPVVFVKDWKKELPGILEREAALSQAEKVKRRQDVIEWYVNFKAVMRSKLVKVIQDKFFRMGNR